MLRVNRAGTALQGMSADTLAFTWAQVQPMQLVPIGQRNSLLRFPANYDLQ
jgi:hypothetical protein